MRTRRFRYGSMSVIITALVIAAVILLNVIFSALGAKYLWYIDMTRENLYTISDACYDLLDETFKTANERREEAGQENVKVQIKFCDAYDNLMDQSTSRLVLTTALELAARYPDTIEVEHLDIYRNPSSVTPYKTSVHSTFVNTDVIVVSGGEYRPYRINSFFLTSSESGTAWAYFGEKRLATAIVAVTQVEKPIAGVLMGHGESYQDAALVSLLELAGYEIRVIDNLLTYEMPDSCRTLVCYNPKTDFLASGDGVSELSEIQILEDFLAKDNRSLMVFFSPETPTLPNFESYLELWGIEYARNEEGLPLLISESADKALTTNGHTFIGQYETTGLGASITSELRSAVYPPKVVFKNAVPIKYADSYDIAKQIEEDGSEVTYGYKVMGAYTRQIFRVFSSSTEATTHAAGKQVGAASANDTYGLMTLSAVRRQTQEDNVGASFADESSYILACGSTEFAAEAILNSNVYGNSETLLEAMVAMGKDAVPVSLSYVPFADTTIDTLTAERANRFTVLLTVIPTVLVFGACIYVIIRRKNK